MKPTWAGWPAVIAAQNADVESTSACLYIGRWDTDSRDWIPEVYDTGITWDLCSNIVTADAELTMVDSVLAEEHDLWTPVGEENTNWNQVPYPE